jgi:RNA polymerase sigma factor (sigma-70 family)
MSANQPSRVLEHLRSVTRPHTGAGLTDGQLLESFVTNREETAFAALVQRHGPMVWGVCRRILDSHHDAEDAFQATFLVLVRRAASVVPREQVANWLYGVAYQTARKARATMARRRGREKPMAVLPEPEVVPHELWNDLRPALDQELSRLPDKYRAVIVLCDLEGKTHKEAARHFHLPQGTVASRLATARSMLARRLARSGLIVSGAALAAVLSPKVASAGLPASVASSTIKAASLLAAGEAASAGAFSIRVVALADGVGKAMWIQKIKAVTVVLMALGITVGGVLMYNHASEGTERTEESGSTVNLSAPARADDKATPGKNEAGQGAIDRVFEIDEINARMLRDVGKRFDVRVVGRKDGLVSGTGLYFMDSDLETAAVHAGLVKVAQEAIITVTVVKCPRSGMGSTRNGVKSLPWEEARPSYTALRLQKRVAGKAAKQPNGNPPPGAKEGKDWSQWRGPNRDGVVHGVKVPRKWPRTLKEQWQVPVGEAYSSPVVANGKVYVLTRHKDDEIVRCFDLANGNEFWRSVPYPAPYKPGPGAPGDIKPRSTPAVAAGKVFTLGVSGVLSCFDAGTGKLLWRKDHGYPVYGASASPLIDNGLCLVQVGTGGLTAFDVATGDITWRSVEDDGGPAYGSPILVDLAGKRQLVTVTQSHFTGIAADSGKLIWELPIPRRDLQQCITPVQYKDLILFAESGEPLRAIRLDKSNQVITAKEVWKAQGHTRSGFHLSSPVLAGDWLFGFSGQKSGHLFCLDARTGRTLWQSDGQLGANATILNAGSVLLVLTSNGRLLVIRPSGTAYEQMAEYRVSDTQTWPSPVFLGDRVLIQDQTTLRCFRIEQTP